MRGAVSIARRLQDPLAELVKIDPGSIGVGLYQHDVDQAALSRALETAVVSAVSSVGVDVNSASPALLRYVSGIGPKTAKALVGRRDQQGISQRLNCWRCRIGSRPLNERFSFAYGTRRRWTAPIHQATAWYERYSLLGWAVTARSAAQIATVRQAYAAELAELLAGRSDLADILGIGAAWSRSTRRAAETTIALRRAKRGSARNAPEGTVRNIVNLAPCGSSVKQTGLHVSDGG
jgi:predicted flap endonuclease-1-like 5' DNA nuclease